eukprot:97347_1
MSASDLNANKSVSKFVCEYKKRTAWFGSFEIRYIVIEDERMKVFKNEKEYVNSTRRHGKPSITVVLRNARLSTTSEQRHPHILSVQVRGTQHFLSFVNKEQLLIIQEVMNKVIASANLIQPTIAHKKYSHDEDDVNTKYRAVLTDLGLPFFKVEELVRSQSFVSKMEIVTQNQYEMDLKSNGSYNKSTDITHWIKLLRRPGTVTITHITDIATLLYQESTEWSIRFINEQGLSLLSRLIPIQINTNDIKFQIELLQCFKAICDKMHPQDNDKIGLQYIVSDVTAIQGIIDLFGCSDPQVSILIIKLLSVICWHSPQGFEKVMDALELYAQNTNNHMHNQSIWIPIMVHLKPMIAQLKHEGNELNEFAAEYVLFTIGLINAILNSFCLLEDRVLYRKDLEQLGFDKIIAYLSDFILAMEEQQMQQEEDPNDHAFNQKFSEEWIDKMDEHIDLYQAVQLKDLRDSSLDGIDVSHPTDLFHFLDQHCVEDGYLNEFTHILQCLTTIPRNAPYIWSTIEKVVSYSTAPIRKLQLNDILQSPGADCDAYENDLHALSQQPEHAFPSFEQLKAMLARYDQDLDMDMDQMTQYKEQIALLQQQITNLKYKLTEQQLAHGEENKQLKMAQQSDFFEILNQNRHKRSQSLLDKVSQIFKLNGSILKEDGVEDAHQIDVTNAWQTMTELHTSTTDNTPPPHAMVGLPPPPPLDDDEDDEKNEQKETNKETQEATSADGAEGIGDPPAEIEKYLRMMKMRVPLAAVQNKMTQNGHTDHIDTLEFWFNRRQSQPQAKPEAAAPTNTDKADNQRVPPPELEKYLRMIKMKIPLKVVKNKMKVNGDKVQMLEDWLNPNQKEPPAEIKKYLRMMKMKIPLNVIKNKMKQNGDGKHVQTLENWLNGGSSSTTTKPKSPPPEIEKYLRMIKMKIPLKVIKNKMKQNGDGKHVQTLENWLNGDATKTHNPKPKERKLELPPGMKPKPKIKPNKKMKALHWSTINPVDIKQTIWDGLDESTIKMDREAFEHLFQQKKSSKKNGKDKDNKQKGKGNKRQNEEIHLVDGKRSYNVDIGLSRFKLSHQQIRDAILLLDESAEGLNLDGVIKLRKYVPDAEEQELLRTFEGDATLLAHTERFFLALSHIPELNLRMELWQFKLQFNELSASQMERISILRSCHDNVRHNKSFRVVLQYILAFGNYMNAGTRKGQAFGFKLNSLKQIMYAKSMDNKTTLLHYLYIEIEKQDANVLQFTKDFEILSQGSRLDITEISGKINKIGASLNRIHKKVSSPSNIKCDLFAKKMKAFLGTAQPQFKKLKDEHDAVKSDCTQLAEYLNCKNDIKFEYLKSIYEFSQHFKKIGSEIEKERELKAKQLKNAQIKAARQQRMQKKRQMSIKHTNGNTKHTNGKHRNRQHPRSSSNQAKQIYTKNRLAKKRTTTATSNTNGNTRPSLATREMGTSITESVVYDIKMSAVERRRKASSNISRTSKKRIKKRSPNKKQRWFG